MLWKFLLSNDVFDIKKGKLTIYRTPVGWLPTLPAQDFYYRVVINPPASEIYNMGLWLDTHNGYRITREALEDMKKCNNTSSYMVYFDTDSKVDAGDFSQTFGI